MKKIVIFFIYLLGVVSCSNSSMHNEKNNYNDTLSSPKHNSSLNSRFCFAKMEKDTVFLQIFLNDSDVSGILKYHIFEKDANSGTITGKLSGDTLIADYDFQSEGIQSVRQVVFLIKDSTAIEGFGEMKDENGRMVFKNMHDLNFQNGLILKKADCTNNKE